MEEKSTEDKVKAVVKCQLGVHDKQIVREASLVEDLGADSLDVVELVMAIEEEFDICIPEGDAEGLNTVGSLIDYVKERCGQ